MTVPINKLTMKSLEFPIHYKQLTWKSFRFLEIFSISVKLFIGLQHLFLFVQWLVAGGDNLLIVYYYSDTGGITIVYECNEYEKQHTRPNSWKNINFVKSCL